MMIGCAKTSDIEDLQDQIDELKSDKIASIQSQLTSIEGTIIKLNAMDAELKGYIETLQNQTSNLYNTSNELAAQIAKVKADLQSEQSDIKQELLSKLEAYQTSVNGQIEIIYTSIASLQAKDTALQDNIDSLKKYVDSELKNVQDWVNSTFATLEQYNALCQTVAGIQTQINAINVNLAALEDACAADKAELEAAISNLNTQTQSDIKKAVEDCNKAISTARTEIQVAYEKAIKDAITTSELSMKSWVNEQLTGYYTIAQMDAKLKLLKDGYTEGDSALEEEIDDLSAALEKAKTDIKAAYETAIQEAIEANNGTINAKIAADIKTASDELQTQINSINSKISDIEKRLGLIEDRLSDLETGAIVNSIQSITYVPRYADSKSTMWYIQAQDGTIRGEKDTLDFVIKPSGKASELVATEGITFSANAAYNAITRAAVSTIDLPVVNVSSNGDILSVIINGEGLNDDFFMGTVGASMRFEVKSKLNDMSSESVQATPAQKATVYFADDSISVYKYEHQAISYKTYPAAADLKWTSSDPSVATVDNTGKVTGKAVGKATITATTIRGSLSDSLDVTVSEPPYVFLSKDGTANCYLVSAAGDYAFYGTVKGNSSESVGTPVSAVVLWETFGTSTAPNVGDVIKTVTYDDGIVKFSTPGTLVNGNALIAVKDANGEILWSWHIWVCKDYDPIIMQQVYANDAGIMMDRDLGATSATPGSVNSFGLLYQWGRKDPFMGNTPKSSNTAVLSSVSWPSAANSSSLESPIAYSIANPMIFIKYWTSDVPLWSTTKTKYDPCPVGWMVPSGAENGLWATAFSTYNTNGQFQAPEFWDYTNCGMLFSSSICGASAWYPACGYIDGENGVRYYTGDYGYRWSTTAYSSDRAYVFSILYHSKHYSTPIVRTYEEKARTWIGNAVRCCKE